MAQTRTRQQGEEDFFAGLEKGHEIKQKHQDLQLRRQQLRFDTIQELAKMRADEEKLKIDMLKAGINPGAQNRTRVGSYDPFTGEQVPGGVLYDPVAGTAVQRRPVKKPEAKGLSPRDLADLRYAMDDPALAPFLEDVLVKRGVAKEAIDQFKQATQTKQEQMSGGGGSAGGTDRGKQKYSPAQADSQGRVKLQEWVVGLGKISKKAPFERVAQAIITDPDLDSEEKQRLLFFARKRFQSNGGQ